MLTSEVSDRLVLVVVIAPFVLATRFEAGREPKAVGLQLFALEEEMQHH